MPRQPSDATVGVPSAFGGRRAQSTLVGAHFAAAPAPGGAQREGFWRTVLADPEDAGAARRALPHVGVRCSECGAMFRGSGELTSHRDSKHRRHARQYRCSTCETLFSQRSHLNQHIRGVHERQRPYRCDKCNRSFGKRFDLASHKSAVHENNRPHVCPLPSCARPFAKRSNLTRHIVKLHAGHPTLRPERAASTAPSPAPVKRPRLGRS